MKIFSEYDAHLEQCGDCNQDKDCVACASSEPGSHSCNCSKGGADGKGGVGYLLKKKCEQQNNPRPKTMDFLSALKSGRPIRRVVWLQWGPQSDPELLQKKLAASWAFLRVVRTGDRESAWLNIGSGELMAMGVDDYLADDWEVMP